MKRTLIIISILIVGAAAYAENDGMPDFSRVHETQPLPPPAPVHLDSAQRILEGSPQPEYYNNGSYGNRNVYYPYGYVDAGSGKVYGPYGKHTNNYGY